MKILILILAGCFVGSCLADNTDLTIAKLQVQAALKQRGPLPWKKGLLVVPSSDVAAAIHLSVAGAIFGKDQIVSEQPFHAIRYQDFWVVYGTLPHGHLMGGTAVTVLRASTGEVLRVIHEQ